MCPTRWAKAYGTLASSIITWCLTISWERTGRVMQVIQDSGSRGGLSRTANLLAPWYPLVITEGAKVPGECGVALTSSILCLVPTLPLDLGASIDHRFTTGEGVQDHSR